MAISLILVCSALFLYAMYNVYTYMKEMFPLHVAVSVEWFCLLFSFSPNE